MSGVAFACRRDNAWDIDVYRKWPGCEHENACKVPTRLLYDRVSSSPKLWGFHCQSEREEESDDNSCEKEKRWFKLLLDEKVLDNMDAEAPGTHANVKRWITDFLRHIYIDFMNHVQSHAILMPKVWRSANVEFVFSIPTTWERQEIIEDFRKIIKDAGFGGEGRTNKIHPVTISLTEASAAAVCTFKDCPEPLKKDQSFIVCDAGGGTTVRSAAKLFLRTANLFRRMFPFSMWWKPIRWAAQHWRSFFLLVVSAARPLQARDHTYLANRCSNWL